MSDVEATTSEADIDAMLGLGDEAVSPGLGRRQLAGGARLRVGRVAMLLAGLAWLPPLILAAAEDVAWGSAVQVPFLKDFLPYGQLLISIPALVVGEFIVGRHLARVMVEFRESEILDSKGKARLDTALARTIERWRGRKLNVVLLVLTCIATAVSVWGADDWLTGGWQVAGDGLTMAGWWYLLISLPVMRFLALRWLWRMLLWAAFLWQLSRLDLHPQPAHPDRAGGLAFLGGTQAVFGVFVFAFGVQLSCLIADGVHFRGEELMAFRGEVIAFAVISVVALLLPLLVFAPKLSRARQAHLLFLSGSAHRGAGDLERKLRASESGELPADAVSGLADFSVLYEHTRLMRPVPLELQHVLALVMSAILPFLPLVLLVMPAREVLHTLLRLLV